MKVRWLTRIIAIFALIGVVAFVLVSNFTIRISPRGYISLDVNKAQAAITVTLIGTGASTKAGIPEGRSLGYPAGGWQDGDVIIVTFAGDISANTPVCDLSNVGGTDVVFVKDSEADNSGQAVAQIWRGPVIDAGTGLRSVNVASTDAFAATCYKVTGLASSPLDTYPSNTGSGTDASTGSTGTLAQDDEIVFAVTAVEDEIDDAHGTWTTGTGYVSGNEQFDATNGGGDASNMQVHSVARIVSDGTSQAYQGVDAGHDSTDWAACAASYKMAAGGTPSIQNAPSSEALGVVSASSTYYAYGSAPSNPVTDGECTFEITNNGPIAIDVAIKSTNPTGGNGWTLTSGSPGSDTVRLTAYYSGQDPASGVVVNTTDQAFASNITASATLKWDFKFETGTFTDGALKSWTITLTASAH